MRVYMTEWCQLSDCWTTAERKWSWERESSWIVKGITPKLNIRVQRSEMVELSVSVRAIKTRMRGTLHPRMQSCWTPNRRNDSSQTGVKHRRTTNRASITHCPSSNHCCSSLRIWSHPHGDYSWTISDLYPRMPNLEVVQQEKITSVYMPNIPNRYHPKQVIHT